MKYIIYNIEYNVLDINQENIISEININEYLIKVKYNSYGKNKSIKVI